MSIGDINLDGHMSFEEFVKYVADHEKKLWIVFKTIDQNNTGENTSQHTALLQIICFI